MPSRNIADLHPNLQPICRRFLQDCKEAGLDILVTCTYRSIAEQDQLYAQGRSQSGLRVTNAKGGQSEHNFMIGDRPAALAFDVVPLRDGKPIWDSAHPVWQQVGKIGMRLGLKWYGHPKAVFREFPHFALPRSCINE